MTDCLDKGRIFDFPRNMVIGSGGEVRDSVDSTMNVASRRIEEGCDDGYVILAEMQKNGRGRNGRWECPAGRGILLSTVLTFGMKRKDRMLAGLLGAVAGAETVAHFGIESMIKWPNDIVVPDSKTPVGMAKIGGVLVEQRLRGDTAPAHVLGVGLNVNQNPSELPDTAPLPSISMKTACRDRHFDRNRVCKYLIERLDYWYGKLKLGHREALLARWRTLSCLTGKRVRAETDGETVEGTVIGLRSSGELIMRLQNGRTRLLTSERTKLCL